MSRDNDKSVSRAATWVRTSETGALVVSLVVGAGAGLGAIAFRWLIATVTRLFTGHDDYAGAVHLGNPHLPWLGPWVVLATPVVAGLLYGPLVHAFAREARGHGVPEVMYAVARRGGRIRPQVAGVKALASALCIGGGGSVGREGPIVQIGAALGSTVGGVLSVPESQRRVLVACGAAAGISATFNAPLAGVFFAMELILADFAARSFGLVVLSSVTASVIARAALGDDPFLTLPVFRVEHVAQYGLFAVLGVLAGVVGVGFTRVLYAVEDLCDWAWRGPEWLRPAVGGLLLGGVLLVLPQMYGVGYPVLGDGVAGRYSVVFLLVLLVGKALATSLTIGIGGSGGVFAPSLFVGAMLGAAFGQGLAAVAPSVVGAPGAYALIGMGAVFAGAARAPITAVVILFELTGEYTVIVPLMVAIVLATGVSHLLSPDTVYSLKLRRRGVVLGHDHAAGPLDRATVASAMGAPGAALDLDASLAEAVVVLDRSEHGQVLVVDGRGRYAGVVTAQAVTEALAADDEPPALRSLVEASAHARDEDTLAQALAELEVSGPAGLPVLGEGDRPVGWLTPERVLRALRRDGPAQVAVSPSGSA